MNVVIRYTRAKWGEPVLRFNLCKMQKRDPEILGHIPLKYRGNFFEVLLRDLKSNMLAIMSHFTHLQKLVCLWQNKNAAENLIRAFCKCTSFQFWVTGMTKVLTIYFVISSHYLMRRTKPFFEDPSCCVFSALDWPFWFPKYACVGCGFWTKHGQWNLDMKDMKGGEILRWCWLCSCGRLRENG